MIAERWERMRLLERKKERREIGQNERRGEERREVGRRRRRI